MQTLIEPRCGQLGLLAHQASLSGESVETSMPHVVDSFGIHIALPKLARPASQLRSPFLHVRNLWQCSDDSCAVRNTRNISDVTALTQDISLRSRLITRIAANPDEVWVPCNFADLGNRPVIDKSLQRLVATGDLRRIDRGLYDRPRKNT